MHIVKYVCIYLHTHTHMNALEDGGMADAPALPLRRRHCGATY